MAQNEAKKNGYFKFFLKNAQGNLSRFEGYVSESANYCETFFAAAAENLQKSTVAHDYLKSRGITLQTATALGWGWADEAPYKNKDTDKFVYPNGAALGYFALIFPIRDPLGKPCGISWRCVNAEKGDSLGAKFVKSLNCGVIYPCDLALLKSQTPCFFCEAPIDAASLIQSGFHAVSLFGVRNFGGRNFGDFLKNKEIAAPLIFAGDNDPAGIGAFNKGLEIYAQGDFYNGVNLLNERFFAANSSDWAGCKDINELFLKNPALLKARAFELVEKCQKAENFLAKYYTKDYNEPREPRVFSPLADYHASFIERVVENKNLGAIPTFSNELNAALGGGFKNGRLYVLSALPALGKTALALQFATHAAELGRQVLFFSFELSADDLVARVASRLFFENKEKTIFRHGYSTDEVLSGDKVQFDELEKVLIEADERFFKNIFVECAGFGDALISAVDFAVADFVETHALPPFVIVDYFQIIETLTERQTDKQKADEIVTRLKNVAIRHNVPLLVVSAISRANYETDLGMDAAKESGKIEYTADVLMALQIAVDAEPESPLESIGGEKPNKKSKKPAPKDLRKKAVDAYFENTRAGDFGKVEIKIIKNRHNAANQRIPLYFNPLKNMFKSEPPAFEKEIFSFGSVPDVPLGSADL